MITVEKQPEEDAFIGNGIRFEVQTDGPELVKVDLSINGEKHLLSFFPFKSGNGYRFTMDLADYFVSDTPYLLRDAGKMITEITGFTIPYSVIIGGDYRFRGYAFRGGISKKAFALLQQNDLDMFSYRLDSPTSQFLFTTRTNEAVVSIRETELHPFVFIHPGLDMDIKSGSGNKITLPVFAKGSICALDMTAIRSEFERLHKERSSLFEVYVYGEKAFTLRILAPIETEDRYLIRFRNSLGAFELLEVTGAAIHAPEFTDEDNSWQSFTEFGFFEDQRNRSQYKEKIEVESGYRTRNEYSFLQDMIGSAETYLIWPDGSEDRCHVSVENLKYAHRQLTPNSIPLTLTMVTDEQFVTPLISPRSISEAGIPVWATPDGEVILTPDDESLIKYLP